MKSMNIVDMIDNQAKVLDSFRVLKQNLRELYEIQRRADFLRDNITAAQICIEANVRLLRGLNEAEYRHLCETVADFDKILQESKRI